MLLPVCWLNLVPEQHLEQPNRMGFSTHLQQEGCTPVGALICLLVCAEDQLLHPYCSFCVEDSGTLMLDVKHPHPLLVWLHILLAGCCASDPYVQLVLGNLGLQYALKEKQ